MYSLDEICAVDACKGEKRESGPNKVYRDYVFEAFMSVFTKGTPASKLNRIVSRLSV